MINPGCLFVALPAAAAGAAEVPDEVKTRVPATDTTFKHKTIGDRFSSRRVAMTGEVAQDVPGARDRSPELMATIRVLLLSH